MCELKEIAQVASDTIVKYKELETVGDSISSLSFPLGLIGLALVICFCVYKTTKMVEGK